MNAGDNSQQNQGRKTPVVWTRVENGQQQNSFSRVIHTMVEGVRSRGRPRGRWRDGVLEDIQEQGPEFSEATSLASKRTPLKRHEETEK